MVTSTSTLKRRSITRSSAISLSQMARRGMELSFCHRFGYMNTRTKAIRITNLRPLRNELHDFIFYFFRGVSTHERAITPAGKRKTLISMLALQH